MLPTLTLTRRYPLPALHVLSGEGLTPTENLQVFGGCSRLHGHDYVVEVSVRGVPDSRSGWLISRDDLDRLVKSRLLDPLVGRNLSLHFRHTTGEALCLEFLGILRDAVPPPAWVVGVTVHETAKNSFTASLAVRD